MSDNSFIVGNPRRGSGLEEEIMNSGPDMLIFEVTLRQPEDVLQVIGCMDLGLAISVCKSTV